MKNKIKLIKFYQGVAMAKGTITSYQPEELRSAKDSKEESKIELTERGVLIIDSKDTVLVPWNNVAYVQYMHETETKTLTKVK